MWFFAKCLKCFQQTHSFAVEPDGKIEEVCRLTEEATVKRLPSNLSLDQSRSALPEIAVSAASDALQFAKLVNLVNNVFSTYSREQPDLVARLNCVDAPTPNVTSGHLNVRRSRIHVGVMVGEIVIHRRRT